MNSPINKINDNGHFFSTQCLLTWSVISMAGKWKHFVEIRIDLYRESTLSSTVESDKMAFITVKSTKPVFSVKAPRTKCDAKSYFHIQILLKPFQNLESVCNQFGSSKRISLNCVFLLSYTKAEVCQCVTCKCKVM